MCWQIHLPSFIGKLSPPLLCGFVHCYSLLYSGVKGSCCLDPVSDRLSLPVILILLFRINWSKWNVSTYIFFACCSVCCLFGFPFPPFLPADLVFLQKRTCSRCPVNQPSKAVAAAEAQPKKRSKQAVSQPSTAKQGQSMPQPKQSWFVNTCYGW